MIGKKTITIVITLGRISLRSRRQFEAPSPVAASTNSLCRSDSTSARIGRATYGRKTTPMMRIGSRRLPDSILSGPTANPPVISTVERLIASR